MQQYVRLQDINIMHIPDSLPTDESLVSVHTARSWTEAMVVRGLLESAGIPASELGMGSPSPMPDLAHILYGIDIYTLKSQADRARQLIAEYFAEIAEDEESSLGEI